MATNTSNILSTTEYLLPVTGTLRSVTIDYQQTKQHIDSKATSEVWMVLYHWQPVSAPSSSVLHWWQVLMPADTHQSVLPQWSDQYDWCTYIFVYYTEWQNASAQDQNTSKNTNKSSRVKTVITLIRVFEQHAVNKIPFAQLTGDNT